MRTYSVGGPEPEAFLIQWRMHGLGLVRIVFGVALAIDASLKWCPAFSAGFVNYLTDATEEQPQSIKAWIAFWIGLVHSNPLLFAHTVATLETLVAIGLVLGAFSTIVYACGAVLMFVIWSTAEGFGGPYKPGSTDIGAAIIYVVVFAALFFTRAGLYLGLDRLVGRKLGRWSWLASGRVPNDSDCRRLRVQSSSRAGSSTSTVHFAHVVTRARSMIGHTTTSVFIGNGVGLIYGIAAHSMPVIVTSAITLSTSTIVVVVLLTRTSSTHRDDA